MHFSVTLIVGYLISIWFLVFEELCTPPGKIKQEFDNSMRPVLKKRKKVQKKGTGFGLLPSVMRRVLMILRLLKIARNSIIYTLKTGTPVEDVDPILKLLRGVSRP